MRNCPNCGGKIEGDGYQTPFHCENTDLDTSKEPDSEVQLCSQNLSIEDYLIAVSRLDPHDLERTDDIELLIAVYDSSLTFVSIAERKLDAIYEESFMHASL